MKRIIDIDEKDYKAFMELVAINLGRCNGKSIIQSCLRSIRNSTPLNECDDCIRRSDVDKLTCRYLKEPTDNHVAFYEHLLDLPSVYPKSDKPSGKCKDCGYYEKCTNLCTKHDNEKVFRNPNWYCADFVMVEEQGECT